MTRVAVLDIGTVTARLAVADVERGRVVRLAKQSNIVNLGQDVDRTRRLRTDAIERLLGCVDAYLATAREAKAPLVCCTLTSAARDAHNSAELHDELDARGLKAQVIPGEVEGSLTFLGVAQDFGGQRIAVADNGGGSTEVAVGSLGQDGVLDLEWVHSINVGSRRITEKYLAPNYPPTSAGLKEAHAFAAAEFAPWMPWAGGTALSNVSTERPGRLVITGGTSTTLVAVQKHLDPYDPRQVHLAHLSRKEVGALEEHLASLTLEELEQVPGLQAKRAPVIVGGVVAIHELLNAGGFDEYTASESDLLFGLSLTAAATAQGEPSPVGWRPELALL